MRDGNQLIDVSSAAWGAYSTIPIGSTWQHYPYTGTVYQFDPILFHNPDQEFDIDDAEAKLFALIKSPHAVDGCSLVRHRVDKAITCNRKRSWNFICSMERWRGTSITVISDLILSERSKFCIRMPKGQSWKEKLSKNRHPMFCPLSGPHAWLYLQTYRGKLEFSSLCLTIYKPLSINTHQKMLLKYHTDCILSCSNASPIEIPKRCPNTLTKPPKEMGICLCLVILYFNLPKHIAIPAQPPPPV